MKKSPQTAKVSLFLISILIFLSCKKTENDQVDSINIETRYVDSVMQKNRLVHLQEPGKLKEMWYREREKIKDSINYHKINNRIALCYFYDNRSDSAFMLWRTIMDYCNRQDPNNLRASELESKLYNDIGSVLVYSEQNDSAVYYLEKAAEATKRTHDGKMSAMIYINMASTNFNMGNYASAASEYRKALSVVDSLKSDDQKMLEPIINYSLARLYIDLQNFSLADYYLNILEEESDSLSSFDKNMFLLNKGHYYYTKEEYPEALEWFRKSFDLARSFEHENFSAVSETNLGEVFLAMDRLDSAEYYLNNASKYFSATDENPSSVYYVEGLLASLCLRRNELKKAELILAKMPDNSDFDPRYIYQHNKRFEELYKRKGDYGKAYEYRVKADVYNDSLRNVIIRNNVAETDMRYRQDTTLLRRDIIISQKEQKLLELQNLNIIIAALLVVIVLTVIVLTAYIRKRRERRYARLAATITSLRMENVRNRISPHYMFNILNSIMPSFRQHEELALPVKYLIRSIRGNMLVSEKIAITLKEETAIVKDYILLRKSINPDAPDVTWDIAPDVNMSELLPSMIIQIPVENAIKYAFDSSDPENIITITIRNNNTFLSVVIADNGKGFDPQCYDGSRKGTGNGLKILYKTIELLNTKNQQKILFEIRNLNHESPEHRGTRVRINVPFNFNFE